MLIDDIRSTIPFEDFFKVQEDVEDEVLQMYIKVCQAKLDSYQTTLQQDIESLKQNLDPKGKPLTQTGRFSMVFK
jgi:hypothetical protein